MKTEAIEYVINEYGRTGGGYSREACSELAALKEQVQNLEEALRPFALYAQALGVDEDCDPTDAIYSNGPSHLTVGAFLDALHVDQAALDQKERE